MKKMKKSLLFAVVTAVLMLGFVFGVSALAETGQCGEDAYWSFNADTGELIISGTGGIGVWNDEEASLKYDNPFIYNKDIKSIVINEGITSIFHGAFNECRNLSEVFLPESLRVIGSGAFSGCDNISYIDIPDGVTTLEYGCFGFCTKMERVIIPKSVKTIGGDIFDFCTSNVLKEIVYKGTEEEWSEVTVGVNNQLLQKHIKYDFCENHINTVDYPEQAPTCTEAGFTEGTYCNDCGYWFSGHLFIKPLRHTDSENDGICDVCKGTSSDIIIGQDTVIVGNGEKDVLRLIPEKSGIFTIDAGGYINEVYIYDVEAGKYVCNWENWLRDIKLEAGKLYKVSANFDEGYYVRGNLLITMLEEITESNTGDENVPTTDPENDKPSDEETPDSSDDIKCVCICHKKGFSGFIYKIVLFFWKLFKTNQFCKCGVTHY